MNLPLKTQNGPVVPAAYVGINTGGGQMAAANDQPLPPLVKVYRKGPGGKDRQPRLAQRAIRAAATDNGAAVKRQLDRDDAKSTTARGVSFGRLTGTRPGGGNRSSSPIGKMSGSGSDWRLSS